MRRTSVSLVSLALLALCIGNAGAAIMAIDLGSEFLKISIVKVGRIPISIVNNEMSKRKSPAAVAFVNGDRLVGDEAASLAVRYPDRVFTRLRDLLGRRYDDPAVARLIKDSRLPFTVVQAPNRTSVAVQVGGKGGDVYTAEELVASLLEYAKNLAIAAAEGSPVSDTVLVVPAFWSPAQRQALLDAAELAGLNVMSLVHTHAAAALQYGIERDFTNKTEDVLFYDLGAGAAEAALVRFSSFHPAGAPAGSPAISQFEVKDVAWVDHAVGCDTLEAALVEHFAKQHKSGADAVLSTPRAVAKLRKQVKRTKEVLSANSEAPVIVEELVNGEDFRGRITREEFEGLVSNVWERAVAPVTEILQRNNLTTDNLSAVELLGGCSRVPRVKAALTEALGGRSLDMHLDADEAVVLGAGLYAANLSTIFRLRKFGMTDKAPYTVTFKLEGADEGGDAAHAQEESKDEETGPRVLVPALRKIPTKRAIALHNLTVDSFSVNLQYDNSIGAVLPCCARNEALGDFQVSGIDTVVAKHGHSGKVALHTVVDQSGIFSVDRADASVEVEEEMKIKVPSPFAKANDTTAGTNSTSNSTDTTKSGDDKETAGGASSAGNTTDTASAPSAPAQEEVTKKWKRTIRIPLNVTGSLTIPGLTVEQRLASRKVLRGLRERDEAKRATAKARNDLEAYVINTREKLDSSEMLKAVSSEEQRDEIKAALMDAEDWLYGDGDTATGTELREKLRKLRKAGDAIELRAAEAASRPAMVQSGLDFVELVLKAANSWPTVKPWLNETEVESVVSSVKEFKEWIEHSVAEQAKRGPHEDLVFKVAEISRRMDPLRRSFTRLNNKPKPIEKKPVEVKIDVNATAANETASIPDGSSNTTTIPEGTSNSTTTESIPEDSGAGKGAEEKATETGAQEETKEENAAGHDEL